ncbi:RWDD4-like protein [Mya arenaria]|uniref:RWDD4-like protein n=1 Tax=Mya arenaria TaxID=6604 RepID=A0ABY7DXH5_MYAAR|nr:RWD domain-containing protein 4-like [Mya arenaria]WAR02433.1 RWDD4-like protein [Mya arenaria]
MSCNLELQEEELEVLRSIYEGDDMFKETGTNTFQYKYGEDNSHRSLLVEISWGDSYPDTPPTVNLTTFYNKHIIDSVKTKIKNGVLEQAADLEGSAMTYSLFEWVKENYDELITEQPESALISSSKSEDGLESADRPDDIAKKKERKDQLTKQQKRRLYEKMGNATGEKPRGWDWVDVVKHLSQSGGQTT